MERMKWLAIIVDSTKNLKGGAVCSGLHSFVFNGSPSTRVFIGRILKEVCAPILSMMRIWMTEGTLNDPFGEFFVSDTQLGSDQ
jgi:gamma-tubulin complex component 3